MARKRPKLILKQFNDNKELFEILTVINTLDHGIPGDQLHKSEVEEIIKVRNFVPPNIDVVIISKDP